MPPTPAPASQCWRCRQEADPSCALQLELVSAAKRNLDPLGHTVKTRNGVSKIRIAVPRCRACRSTARLHTFTFLACSALGGGIALGLYWLAGPGTGNPPPFVLVDEELTKWLLGFGGLFIGAMCAMLLIVRHQVPGMRKHDDYPPIAALREIGWDYPTSD